MQQAKSCAEMCERRVNRFTSPQTPLHLERGFNKPFSTPPRQMERGPGGEVRCIHATIGLGPFLARGL